MNVKLQQDKHSNKLNMILCILATTLIFTLSTFGVNNELISKWDSFSEVIPIGRIIQMQNNQNTKHFFMGIYTEDWGNPENYNIFLEKREVSPEQFMAYPDQIGFHGTMFGFVNKILLFLPITQTQRLEIIYFCNVFFASLMTSILLYAINKRFGIYSYIGSLLVFILGKNYFLAIHNLYWIFGMKIMPTVVMCVIIKKAYIDGTWKKRYYLYNFFAMLLCLCCTYEFVSTEMILAMIPLFLWWFDNKSIKRFIILIKSSILYISSFIFSLLIWMVQCLNLYGNMNDTKQHLWYIIASRSGLDAVNGEALSEIGKSITIYDVLKRFLWEDYSNIYGEIKPIHIIIVAIIIMLFTLIILLLKKNFKILDFSCLVLVILGFMASSSWMIISQGHSYYHFKITPVLWWFGFFPCIGAFIGKQIEYLILTLKPCPR